MTKLQFDYVETLDGSVELHWVDAENGGPTSSLKLSVGEWRDLARTADRGLFAAKNPRPPRQRQHTRTNEIETQVAAIDIVRKAIVPRTVKRREVSL